MKMKNFKSPKGITLIALVVTIIVLITLSVVSINLVLGERGILSKAREARNNYQIAANEEAVVSAGGESIIDSWIEGNHTLDLTKDRWTLKVTGFFEGSGRFDADGYFYLDENGIDPQGTWAIDGETLTANAWGETITLVWDGEKFAGEFLYGGGTSFATTLTKINGFKFKIDGVEYLADEGSKWRDWLMTVDAKRNGYKFGNWNYGNVVKNSNGDIVLSSQSTYVDIDDIIEPGVSYVCGTPVTDLH